MIALPADAVIDVDRTPLVEVSPLAIAPQEPTMIDPASWAPGRQAPRVRLSSRWVVDPFDGRPSCIWFVEPSGWDETAWPFAADWPIQPSMAEQLWGERSEASGIPWPSAVAGVAARGSRLPRLLAIRALVAASAAASLLMLAVQHASPRTGIVPAARLTAGVGTGP